MLLLECSACGRRELRSVRSIERLEHTDVGIIIAVTCTRCGHRSRIRTGIRASRSLARAC